MQRPRLSASHIVIPVATLASAQATPTFAVLALKHLPTKPLRSRFVIPAASTATAIPPATLALQGVRRPTGKPPRARLIIAPLGAPQAASTNVVGIRRPTGKPPRPRVVAAPVGSSQAPGVNVAGIRRGPVRNNHSRFFVGIPPTITPTPATLSLHGARWAPIRIARSRQVVPAPLAAPQAPPTLAINGVRRIHPKRAPQARIFVAPIGVAPITPIMVVVYVPKANGSYGIVSWATKVQTFYEVSPLDGGGGTVLVNSDDVARFVRKVAGSRVLDPVESEHWRLTKPYVPEQGDDRNWRAGDG